MPVYNDQDVINLDILNKERLGVGARDETILPTSEMFPSERRVRSSKVFLNNLPAVAPATSTAEVTKHYPVAEGGVGIVRLTREQDQADGTTWLAFPTWAAGHASGAATPEKNASIYTDICSYADGPSYTVMFYLADGTRILPTGEYGPELQGNAGIVRYKKALPAGNEGTSEATSPYVCFHQRTGDTLADVPWENLRQGATVNDQVFCTMMLEVANS